MVAMTNFAASSLTMGSTASKAVMIKQVNWYWLASR